MKEGSGVAKAEGPGKRRQRRRPEARAEYPCRHWETWPPRPPTGADPPLRPKAMAAAAADAAETHRAPTPAAADAEATHRVPTRVAAAAAEAHPAPAIRRGARGEAAREATTAAPQSMADALEAPSLVPFSSWPRRSASPDVCEGRAPCRRNRRQNDRRRPGHPGRLRGSHLVRPGRALRDPDRTLARAAFRHFGRRCLRTASYDVGTSRGAAQFALLGPEGVDVAIRWRPLRLIHSSRTLCPRAETYSGSKPSMCVCSAASCDVLDADPPRALFSCRRW